MVLEARAAVEQRRDRDRRSLMNTASGTTCGGPCWSWYVQRHCPHYAAVYKNALTLATVECQLFADYGNSQGNRPINDEFDWRNRSQALIRCPWGDDRGACPRNGCERRGAAHQVAAVALRHLRPPGVQVHLVAGGEQRLGDVATDEAGSPGDHDPAHER